MVPNTSSIKLDVIRKVGSKTLDVTLGTMPSQKQASISEDQSTLTHGVPRLGLSVAPASEVAGSGNKGMVVTDVDPEGPAADHGLRTGDVILDVGGEAVNSAGDIRNALSDAKADAKHHVLMKIKTSGVTKFVAIPIS